MNQNITKMNPSSPSLIISGSSKCYDNRLVTSQVILLNLKEISVHPRIVLDVSRMLIRSFFIIITLREYFLPTDASCCCFILDVFGFIFVFQVSLFDQTFCLSPFA